MKTLDSPEKIDAAVDSLAKALKIYLRTDARIPLFDPSVDFLFRDIWIEAVNVQEPAGSALFIASRALMILLLDYKKSAADG